jgi:hypothetical protein
MTSDLLGFGAIPLSLNQEWCALKQASRLEISLVELERDKPKKSCLISKFSIIFSLLSLVN